MKLRWTVVMVWVVIGMAGVSFAGRSPFEAPAVSKDRYNYEEALKAVVVIGLVSTEEGGCAVFERAGEEECEDSTVICRLGETLTVVRDGLAHRFKVHAFQGRTVRLVAADGRAFEVTP